jgi:hypothetical protein
MGFVDGRNLAIEFRWGLDDPDRLLSEAAAELIRHKVDVIATPGFSTAPSQPKH